MEAGGSLGLKQVEANSGVGGLGVEGARKDCAEMLVPTSGRLWHMGGVAPLIQKLQPSVQPSELTQARSQACPVAYGFITFLFVPDDTSSSSDRMEATEKWAIQHSPGEEGAGGGAQLFTHKHLTSPKQAHTGT